MNAAALIVFIIGLRHGADPDHLAVIDNLTRNATDKMPRASRFVGTLFALGHSSMVLVLAAAAAIVGSRIGQLPSSFERAGAIASIGVLLLMAGLNIATLVRGTNAGFRSRFLPKRLREASHPLVAIPIGALFGLGFETSSQLVAYGAAFSSSHLASGLVIGVAFCLGMICTDTVDSLLVARVVTTGRAGAARARRLWIGVVTLIALAVAGKEIAEMSGYALPFDELTLSAATVAVLVATVIVIAVDKRQSGVRDARAAYAIEVTKS